MRYGRSSSKRCLVTGGTWWSSLVILTLVCATTLSSMTGCLPQERMPELTGANTGPYLTTFENLDRIRELIDSGSGIYPDLKASLLHHADSLIQSGATYSVTHQTRQPHTPAGSSHDYVSLARYVWPSESDPDVYEVRDSRTNPEIFDYDRGALGEFTFATRTLALAWYMTRNEIYAERMARLVRIWFLEDLTRMRPHFRYAQFWPGVNKGGPQGIIEATDFITVLDAVSIAEKSASWTTEDHIGLQKWIWEFQQWVLKNYHRDAFSDSNVGTWLDAQKAVYALFTEQEELLNSGNYLMPIEDRIDFQITPDGEQPSEMTRWRSMDYTYFNLKAWLSLIEIRSKVQKVPELSTMVAMRSLTTSSFRGASVHGALEWFYPYAANEGEWLASGFQQLEAFDRCRLIEIYRPAALHLNNPKYESLVQELTSLPECRSNPTLLTHPPLAVDGGL